MELWAVHPDLLVEQSVNARFMSRPVFDQLTATIKADQRLESLPLCAVTDVGVEIVSGHHRVRAARQAGLARIFVLVDVTRLDRDRIRSKQLAHNAIAGEDDADILASIYRAIEDVDLRVATTIDPGALNLSPDPAPAPPVDAAVPYRTVLVMFLPYDHDRFVRATEAVAHLLGSENDEHFLADLAMLDVWRATVDRVSAEYDIRAAGTVLGRIADIVLTYLGDPPGDDPPQVALRDLLGTAVVPADVAAVVSDALRRMMVRGDVAENAPWMALELWAADTLAEPDAEPPAESEAS